jgi:hypothetical protein
MSDSNEFRRFLKISERQRNSRLGGKKLMTFSTMIENAKVQPEEEKSEEVEEITEAEVEETTEIEEEDLLAEALATMTDQGYTPEEMLETLTDEIGLDEEVAVECVSLWIDATDE